MSTLILFLVVLSLLVFVHELGHFLVAKWTGMRVDEFAIGFPPKIFAKKVGETVYSINLIPLGGFVKIYGENPNDEPQTEGEVGFLDKPKLSRFAVLSAGVLFNFIFAWFILSIVFMAGFPSPATTQTQLENARTTIISVQHDSPAAIAGIKEGDVVTGVSLAGAPPGLLHTNDLIDYIESNQDSTITFDVQRGKEALQFNITPLEGIVPGKKAIGVSFADLVIERISFFKAIYRGYTTSVSLVGQIATGMVDFFVDAFSGDKDALSQVAGPVGIAGMVSDASKVGFSQLALFTAVISLNLAVLNLIPFPALDGGQIVFVLIEAVTRKKINPKVVAAINLVGFALLMLLMLVVTFGDIVKLF